MNCGKIFRVWYGMFEDKGVYMLSHCWDAVLHKLSDQRGHGGLSTYGIIK